MVFDKSTQQSPTKGNNNNHNVRADEEMKAARCRQKLLCELDAVRRNACQEKINDVVVRMQQCTDNAVREKVLQQANIWLTNHAKYLKEEQEIYMKLHEEEEESRKRQEQLLYEHEQHAKRGLEISKMISRVQERERENEEQNRQLRLHKRMLTEKCLAFVLEYRTLYEKFLELLKSCTDKRMLGEKFALNITKLKNISELMNHQLPEKCKNMTVNDEDLQTCTETLAEAKSIVETLGSDIERINEEHNVLKAKQKKEILDGKSSAKIDSNRQETANTQSATPHITTTKDNYLVLKDYVDETNYKMYNELNIFCEKFGKSFERLLSDDAMKKFRFECQKAVNTPVNLISPINASHLQDKFTKLQRLLSGQIIESGKSNFSASQHPEGIAFCKDLLAKKFVSQGETTVSSKPEAAFAIAAVIVSLWIEFPDFGQLVLAHFYKECPYLIPFFPPQLVGQSDVDYYKCLGYRYSESGEVEKQDKFLKRMSGIMHLYCAIIVTPVRRHSSKSHPLGIGEGWRWIASIINLEPHPDICATLLYEFLEVAGHSMYKYYGQIFQKILHLLCTEYYHKLEEATSSASRGPAARLESYLQKILKQGKINPPTGLLPVDFW